MYKKEQRSKSTTQTDNTVLLGMRKNHAIPYTYNENIK